MVIRPGLRVSLDVNVPGDARDRVVASLKAKLRENGITVADGQTLRLVARTEPGETHQMKYGNFFGPPGAGATTDMSVTDIKGVLGFTGPDGKFLWQRVAVVTAPSILSPKEGQSVQQAVADAMKPPIALFENTRIPVYVPKSSSGFGTSHLTGTGAQADAK
jgi:hypothetical protein